MKESLFTNVAKGKIDHYLINDVTQWETPI